MNGRVAKSTLPPFRRIFRSAVLRSWNFRSALLAVCCAMSLAMLGAVRLAPQFRPEPLLAVTPPPVAGWNEATDDASDRDVTLGALNTPDEPTLAAAAGVAADDLLYTNAPPVISAPVLPAPATMTPNLALPAATPMLVQPPRRLLMEVTAYCPCHRCCGPRAQGITASGKRVSYNGGRFVAADTKILKFNTKLLIPGYAGDAPVEVIDRGGAIKGYKLDVYFPTHHEARLWGRKKLWVTVVE